MPRRKDYKTLLIAALIGFCFGVEATLIIGFLINPEKYLE